MANKRNLVLSTLFNMKFEAVEPFLSTLRHYNKECDIVFFTSRVSQRDRDILESRFGVICIDFYYLSIRMRQPTLLFWPIWKALFKKQNTFEARSKLALKVFNLFFLRFLLYYNYLAEKEDSYAKILISDNRDVIFQSDPFASDLFESGVHVFAEKDGSTIGSCPSNSRMVRECGGQAVLEELSNKQIYCAGVTGGSSKDMLAYFKLMTEMAFSVETMALVPSADQGLHNILIHQKKIEALVCHKNNGSVVATLGTMPEAEIPTNENSAVVDPRGAIIPVLHQYDRHRNLARKLLENFRASEAAAARSGG